MDPSKILRQRLLSEHLVGAPLESATDVVSWFGAVQAQDYAGSKWGLGQRMAAGTTDAQLDRLFDEGVILRTHVMRPTWHFVTPADIRWLLALTGPRVLAASAPRYRQLELDPATMRKSARVIVKALEGGNCLTRGELGERLERAGISTEGQRLPHQLMHAELEGLICSGPRNGKQQTYALLEERVPEAEPIDPQAALAELARRYFESHGPATPQDFAWWSGLTVGDARTGAKLNGDALVTEEVDGRSYHFAPTAGTQVRLRIPTAHLLPNFDEYLVGYKRHAPVSDSQQLGGVDRIAPALQRHVILMNGRIVGGWRRTVRKDHVQVEANPLTDLNPREWEELERVASGCARFIGLPLAELVRLPRRSR